MKTEFLKGLGLEQEVIDKVMAENGKDVEAAKKVNEDGKAELDTTKAELEAIKKQLEEANTTIDGFKDYEEVKGQVADYKKKFEEAEADNAKIKSDYEFNKNLETAAIGLNALDIKAVMPFLDVEALKNSKNQGVDIEAALKTVKEEKGFLFKSEEARNNIITKGSSGGAGEGGIDAVAKAMGLSAEDMKG